MSKPKARPLPLSASSRKAAAFPILVELPLSIFKGIGKVTAAHAMLEHLVSEIVFDLLKIEYAVGRSAFAYRAASTQFTLVRSLLDVRGIKPSINVVELEDQIRELCAARDQLAHGIWSELDGRVGLVRTEGTYETAEGRRSRAVLPQGMNLPEGYFDKTREVILSTIVYEEVGDTFNSHGASMSGCQIAVK
jgi:hypothetical protein